MNVHHLDYADKTFGVRIYNGKTNRLEVYQWKPEEQPKKCKSHNLIVEYFGSTGHAEFYNEPDFGALSDILKHVARGNLVGRDSVSGCGQKLAGELSDIVTKELEFRQKVERRYPVSEQAEQEPNWTQ